ncbi:cyclic pyranopterin monophosphate synthase MoaC [Methanophagales archaeon]|nr:MAG: cyclic pyranopterin monophosphate synthase MoaC [Methanophagales archaeon]
MQRHDMRMVDISDKGDVARVAVASGTIKLKRSTIEQIKAGAAKKGDVLACAEIAAILAVKKTPDMIPLCHYIIIDSVNVEFSIGEEEIKASVTVKSVGKTGVEMDALCGVSIALLTIWDMVKPVEKDDTGNYPHTRIKNILVEKKEKRA